jgi:hypothetical protein
MAKRQPKPIPQGLSKDTAKDGRFLLKLDGNTIVEASKETTIDFCFSAWKERLEKRIAA